MKLQNYQFLAKANRKRNKRGGAVFALLLLSVLSLMLVTSFSVTLGDAMENFRNPDPARRLSIDSSFISFGKEKLTNEILENIREIDHVLSVDMDEIMNYQIYKIKNVKDGDIDQTDLLPVEPEDTAVVGWSLYKTEKKEVIKGKSLDESPVFSCIIPSSFCPDNTYSTDKSGYELQDGVAYLGKTLTIEPIMDSYDMLYYYNAGDMGYTTKWYYFPALEYKVKVVGIFQAAYDGEGSPNEIYISNETGKKIEQMAVESSADKEFIKQYYADKKKPELHSYTVLVDDADNVNQVRKEMEEMGISVFSSTMQSVPDDVGLFASIFTAAGNFFTVAVLLLTVINLFLSTSNSLLGRKAEIGLLKAIGYKNRQVFWCLYLEQAALGLRAFVIGGGISALAVFVINLINANGAFVNRIYVVSWWDFLALCAAALLLTIIVPLLCELTLLHSMMKISPRQAMAAQ